MSDGVPAVLQILLADAMGAASGGSGSGLQDANKSWTPGQWQDAAIDITIGGVRYRRRVIASGINSLTFEPLPSGVTVSAGDFYFLSSPLAIYKSVMEEVLSKVTEASVDTGIAAATSTVDYLDDPAKSWPVDAFVNLIIEITAGTGAGQIRKIASNTATKIVVATPFTLAPDSTSQYRIGFYGKMASDITHWGGAALSGRDISLDLAKLDIALSTLRDALRGAATKDFSTLEADVEALLSQFDVALSTRASEATLTSVLGQLDITLAALRDAICGNGIDARNLHDLQAELSYVSFNTSKLIPMAKASIFNSTLPTAETNWLGTDITPTNSPSYLRIYVCVSIAGVLRLARTTGGTTLTENLNNGNNLTADAAYMFTVPWRSGDLVNIRYSATSGTIKRLLVDEIGGAE